MHCIYIIFIPLYTKILRKTKNLFPPLPIHHLTIHHRRHRTYRRRHDRRRIHTSILVTIRLCQAKTNRAYFSLYFQFLHANISLSSQTMQYSIYLLLKHELNTPESIFHLLLSSFLLLNHSNLL